MGKDAENKDENTTEVTLESNTRRVSLTEDVEAGTEQAGIITDEVRRQI